MNLRQFQNAVAQWMTACFGPRGPEHMADETTRHERKYRFIEEALELVQACGMSKADAHVMVEYVYRKEGHDIGAEIGDTVVTLAALCEYHDRRIELETRVALEKLWTNIEKIRAKQAGKNALIETLRKQYHVEKQTCFVCDAPITKDELEAFGRRCEPCRRRKDN